MYFFILRLIWFEHIILDMAKDYEKTPDGQMEEIPPDEMAQNDPEYDQQIERLDSFFSTLQPGVTILIERLKPSWCSGLLEEITIGDDAINLDYFIDTWGGQLLSAKVRGKRGRLAGCYKIPLYSYPPLRFGEMIEQSSKGDRFRDRDREDYQQNPAPVVVHPPAAVGTDKIIASLTGLAPFVLEWMKNQEARRQNDMMMMMQMMKAGGGGGGGGIADFSKMAQVMAQLNEVFRQNQGQGDGGGDMDFLPQALDVLKMVLAPGDKSATKAQPKSRLTAGSVAGAPPPRRIAPASPTQPAPVAKVMPLNPPKDIAGAISTMEPKEAAGTLIEAIGRMSPDKRDQAIGHFLTEFQNDMGEEMDDEEDFEDEGGEIDDKRGVRP
jgi:hypothetical protein